MARETTVTLVDDIDGEPAEETVGFGLDGKNYEIDLSEVNSARLREALAPFMAAARRAGTATQRGTAGSAGGARSAVDREENKAKRAWLRENGYEVKERGRIPADQEQAYATKTPAGKTGGDYVRDAQTLQNDELAQDYVRESVPEATFDDGSEGQQTRGATDQGVTDEMIRAWLQVQGKPVGKRITAPQRKAYAEAHSG